MHAYWFLSVIPLIVDAFPQSRTLPLDKRVDLGPGDMTVRIEEACMDTDPDYPKVDRNGKLLKATRNARWMAYLVVEEWGKQGKHRDIAEKFFKFDAGEGDAYWDSKYTMQVYRNLERAAEVSTRVPLIGHDIDLMCTDFDGTCDEGFGAAKNPGGHADYDGHRISMCDRFWPSRTLEETIEHYQNFPNDDFSWSTNDAEKILHELMHLKDITEDRPQIHDRKWTQYDQERLYGATRIVAWVSSGENIIDHRVTNADSYAQFVNAVYLESKLGWLPKISDVPRILDSSLACGTDKGEDHYVHWAQLDKSLTDFCFALEDEWEFGKALTFKQEYNQDTPDHLTIEMKIERDDPNVVNEGLWDRCLEGLYSIKDDCNKDATFKNGGQYTAKQRRPNDPNNRVDDLYELSVQPQTKRPSPIPDKNPAECFVTFRESDSIVDLFMRAGLFAGQDYGKDFLEPALQKCGGVKESAWLYFGEPTGLGFEWQALYNLGWQKGWFSGRPSKDSVMKCVTDAIVAAGADPSTLCDQNTG